MTTEQQRADPDFLPQTQYFGYRPTYVEDALSGQAPGWTRWDSGDITAPTNGHRRTVISAVRPVMSDAGTLCQSDLPVKATRALRRWKHDLLPCQFALSSFGFDYVCPTEGARDPPHVSLTPSRAASRHCARGLRPAFRRHDRPRGRPRPRAPADVHGPRHGALRPGPGIRWRALHMGR